MTNFDLSPLLRGTVGFDRLMGLLENTGRPEETAAGYPPYNIEKMDEDSYAITMAVAGFSEDELTITAKEGSLVVEGKKQKEENPTTYLHRGIATRAFQRSFQLADHIKVVGAELENGLLTINLVREIPEAKKPKTITISNTNKNKPKKLENKAA